MNEFVRPYSIGRLGRRPASVSLAATPEEAAALTQRLGVEAVASLAAALTLHRKGSRLQVSGTVSAVVDRICVVTLEPFRSAVGGEFEEEFLLTDEPEAFEVTVDEETPEPLAGDSIDLGELAVQHLLLMLDPHPRADGADIELLDYQLPEHGTDSPFAVLRQRKPNS